MVRLVLTLLIDNKTIAKITVIMDSIIIMTYPEMIFTELHLVTVEYEIYFKDSQSSFYEK